MMLNMGIIVDVDSNLWCALREFSRCSWLGECVVATVCSVCD